MARGYWLNTVGGLMYGDKMYGDTELTKAEYDALFEFASEHRAQALPLLKLQAELEEVSKANTEAVINEVTAHDAADKARAALVAAAEAFKAAGTVETAGGPAGDPTLADRLAEAEEQMIEAETAANAARAVTKPLQDKLLELQDKLAAMPPKRVATV